MILIFVYLDDLVIASSNYKGSHTNRSFVMSNFRMQGVGLKCFFGVHASYRADGSFFGPESCVEQALS